MRSFTLAILAAVATMVASSAMSQTTTVRTFNGGGMFAPNQYGTMTVTPTPNGGFIGRSPNGNAQAMPTPGGGYTVRTTPGGGMFGR
jgi:hypothetical protein